MAVGPNDINILSVETADRDVPENKDLDVTVEAEVGTTLFGTGGYYEMRMTLVDRTNFKLIHADTQSGNYSNPPWKPGEPTTFTFKVPAAKMTGLNGSILEAQARVVGNKTAPFDASHSLSETIQVTS